MALDAEVLINNKKKICKILLDDPTWPMKN